GFRRVTAGPGRIVPVSAVAFAPSTTDTAALSSPARPVEEVAVPPIDYLVLRTLRRWAPQSIVEWMLDRDVVLRAGRDTVNPEFSIKTYREADDRSVKYLVVGDVLVVCFGVSFVVTFALLVAVAAHVYLQDPNAPVRHARNRRLPAERMAKFFRGGTTAWEA